MFQYNRPKVKWQIQRPSRKVKWNLRVGWEVIWIFYACDESKRKLSYACHHHTDNHLALWSDTIDDHGAPSFPLTDMNKKRRWNTKKNWRKVKERGKAITASKSCSTVSWRSLWSWRASQPRRACECCWMMHRGRRRDRGAASGSRFGRFLHIWLLAVQAY